MLDAEDSAAKMSPAELDLVLTAQIAVAWAGEGGEEPRLGWWRSDMVNEFGGEDLFSRLLPHTWKWAVLQAAREAARRTDAEGRAQHHNPDEIVSLFYLGFELDERIEERLQDLKRSVAAPADALPGLADVVQEAWSKDAFQAWVTDHGKPNFTAEPIGRRLTGAMPPKLSELVPLLLGALNPLADKYPLSHYRRAG